MDTKISTFNTHESSIVQQEASVWHWVQDLLAVHEKIVLLAVLL